MSETSADRTAGRLRQMILDGELAPGMTLGEQDLAKRLGVSRTPLREALAMLKGSGIIIDHPNRSAVVLRPSADDLREIYELRIALESMAIAQAVPQLTDADHALAASLYDQLDASGSVREWARLNHRFHMAFYRGANRRVVTLVDNMRTQSDPYISMLMGPTLKDSQAQHRELLDAVRRRDVYAAVAETRLHLETTLEAVLAVIDGDEDTANVTNAPDAELV